MTEETYTQISKDFSDIVDKAFPKLDILNYYPYGPEKIWTYWLCGKVDLTKEYLNDRNKRRTEKDLVISITQETSRAMNYLMVHQASDEWSRQRIEAFALHRLFGSGWIGWNKKILKGLTEEEKEELYTIHDKRYNLLRPEIKEQENYIKKEKKTKEELKKYNDAMLNCKLYNRKKYGIYEVKYLPLTQHGTNVPKILYTKKELCAINIMVDCAFENLC